MLRLRLDTTYLDLGDVSLQLNIHNPIFDKDGAEAIYSFPFKLPDTPTNVNALSHAHRLDNASNSTTFTNAVLEIDGIMFIYGVLELDGQPFSKTEISAVFRNNISDFWETMERINIRDAVETVTTQLTPPDAYWEYSLNPSATIGVTYKIVIDGTPFSYTATTTQNQEVVTNLSLLIEATFPGLALQSVSESILKLYASEVNNHTPNNATLENLDFDGAVTVGQQTFRGLLNHVNSVNAAAAPSHRFPNIFWENFYLGEVATYPSRINPIWDEAVVENLPVDTNREWTTAFVPFVTVAYVLDRIANTAPSVFTGYTGWMEDSSDAKNLLIFNNRSLDEVRQDRYPPNVDYKYLNAGKTSLRLADHLPDLTAKEFLQNLLIQFGLWIKPTGTSIDFRKKVDQINSTIIDWTELSEPDYGATRKRRRGFTLQYPNLEDEDRIFARSLYDPQLDEYVSGDGFETLPLPAGSLRQTDSAGLRGTTGDPVGKMPIVRQAGSSDEGGIGENDYSFRLFFWRGLQPADNGDTYPMACHDATNYDGDDIGDLSFDLNDLADGLYKQNHKSVVDLEVDGQPVRVPVRLAVQDIVTVMKWDSSRRSVILPEGQMVGVIKKLTFKISQAGMSVSVVDFIMEK